MRIIRGVTKPPEPPVLAPVPERLPSARQASRSCRTCARVSYSVQPGGTLRSYHCATFSAPGTALPYYVVDYGCEQYEHSILHPDAHRAFPNAGQHYTQEPPARIYCGNCQMGISHNLLGLWCGLHAPPQRRLTTEWNVGCHYHQLIAR